MSAEKLTEDEREELCIDHACAYMSYMKHSGDCLDQMDAVERIVAERVARAEAALLDDVKAILMKHSNRLNAAFREHNRGRNLNEVRAIRDDLQSWSHALEAACNNYIRELDE